ncbi:shootin-1-like [Pungitius pungitius]|uniref:shootin-1-like n=1 Tax=Pungitius pungitius TaxID=134920 RepID=UPI002E0D24F3
MECCIEQKEKQLRDQLRVGQQQVETFEGKLKKQQVEMEILREQLKGAKEVIKDAGLQAREQKETIDIFRQKYHAAIEKVHRVQGQVELLEEELQYSQQQLRDCRVAAHSAKEELAGMEQRYLEKVGHWEDAQEALDQLTDELLTNQTLLRESQQRADHLKGLVDTIKQQVHTALLRQPEEQLKEVRREAARRSSDGFAQREEAQRLQEESLGSRVRRFSRELEELRSKLQVTAEELAARAEEARRMEGCLNEGKLAEEKIRSLALRLQANMAELQRNLQQAVAHKRQAEREKQEAQEQVDTLLRELQETRSEKANLRHESQLLMTNVNCWIAEQKASNESLSAQMTAQNKVLLILTEEKDMEKQGCAAVALNLSKIEDMQTRLRSNLEAIRMLNQQLNSLSRENKRLRRQLDGERAARRRAEGPPPPPPPPLPPPAKQSSIVDLPTVPRLLSAPPSPPSGHGQSDGGRCWDSDPNEAERSRGFGETR